MPRTRVLTGLMALVALAGLVAGCSAVPVSPANHVRGALVATRLAGPARVTLSSRTTVLGQSVEIGGNGTVDIASQTADLNLQIPMLGGAVHTVLAGGLLYAQLPSAFALFVPGARSWVSINADRLAQQQLGTSLTQLGIGPSKNPVAQLGYLQGVRDDAREVGPEQIDGTSTTHYAATIDLERTPAATDPASRPAVQRLEAELGTSALPVDVWIDEQGRFRRVTQTLQAVPNSQKPTTGTPPTSQTIMVTFDAFGVPAPMPPPPPDQVTDISQLLPTG